MQSNRSKIYLHIFLSQRLSKITEKVLGEANQDFHTIAIIRLGEP
jgi:hypothetical protein